MTLMFRYHLRLWQIYRLWTKAQRPQTERMSRLAFRCSAADCDLLGHMNNARYLEFMDAGRFALLLSSGLFMAARVKDIQAVAGNISIRYRKELRRGARFELATTIDRREGKALIFKQIFYVENKPATEAEVSILMLQHGKVIAPDVLLESLPAWPTWAQHLKAR